MTNIEAKDMAGDISMEYPMGNVISDDIANDIIS